MAMTKRKTPKRVKFSRKQRHALLAGSPEPTWDEDLTEEEFYKSKLGPAFNWYNYEQDSKDAIKYLIKFCQGRPDEYEQYIKPIKAVADWKVSTTAGWLARMADQGAPLGKKSYEFIKERLEYILGEYEKTYQPSQKETKNKSVHQKIADKALEHISDIEGELDDVILSNFKTKFDSYQFMVGKDIKGKTAQIIAKHFKAVAKEYNQVVVDRKKKIDSDFTEAFENVTTTEVKKLFTLYDEVYQSAKTIADNSAKQRKPKKRRTRKGKSASKLVEKLNYMETFDELKLVSENPEKLIGAKACFIYNTKMKTLTLYMSETTEGFTISRSSIRKFDPSKGGTKRIGKQLKLLETVQKETKIRAIKAFDANKSKINSSSGQINANMVIVKIFR